MIVPILILIYPHHFVFLNFEFVVINEQYNLVESEVKDLEPDDSSYKNAKVKRSGKKVTFSGSINAKDAFGDDDTTLKEAKELLEDMDFSCK